MKSKGVSAVIAVIMMLMITVALAGMAYVWFTGVFTGVTTSVGNQTEQTTAALGTKFVIETAVGSAATATVTTVIRNTGTESLDLSALGAYVADVPATCTSGCSGTLAPGTKSSSITITAAAVNTCNKALRMTGGVGGYESSRTIIC